MSTRSSLNAPFWCISLQPSIQATASLNTDTATPSQIDNLRQSALQSLLRLVTGPGRDYCDVYKWSIPDFKIGTLDQLVLLSDELAQSDLQVEGIVQKLVANLRSLLQQDTSQLASYLVVGDSKQQRPDAYIKTFQWNSIKYRMDRPIRDLAESLQQEVAHLDSVVKAKMTAYQQTKAGLASHERKQTGNLLVKSLDSFVKRDMFVLDSEYLETLLVVVPKMLEKNWLGKYEQLTAMVVPRSSQLITTDETYCLYSVTLFKRISEDFKLKAREEKFIVRDYVFDEVVIEKLRGDYAQLAADAKEQWANLLRLLKTHFGECFAAWLHIKALRLVVESVLRYGLPPCFVSVCLEPRPKMSQKLKRALTQYVVGTGASVVSTNDDHQDDEETSAVLAAGGTADEVWPWVHFPIFWSGGLETSTTL